MLKLSISILYHFLLIPVNSLLTSHGYGLWFDDTWDGVLQESSSNWSLMILKFWLMVRHFFLPSIGYTKSKTIMNLQVKNLVLHINHLSNLLIWEKMWNKRIKQRYQTYNASHQPLAARNTTKLFNTKFLRNLCYAWNKNIKILLYQKTKYKETYNMASLL